MNYEVLVQPPAHEDIAQALSWMEQELPAQASLWWDGLKEALRSLQRFPGRGGLAPENKVFREEIRQLLYGRGRGLYRILYTVQGKTVRVLHVRHGAQRPLTGPE